MGATIRRVGHKGADAVVPGNTVASFEAAVGIGVDMIEFDVLWTPEGHPDLPPARRKPLVVAHDWEAAAAAGSAGQTLTLEAALAAFAPSPGRVEESPSLTTVEIDCDLKLPGREDELVAELRNHGLIERAMVSTMEISSLSRIAGLEPGLRRGWTYPRVTRDWTARRWAVPGVAAALVVIRRRLPALAARQLPRLGVDAMWVYYPLITARLAEVTAAAGVELIAWTVDDADHMARLAAIGVDGLCTNDPRLFG